MTDGKPYAGSHIEFMLSEFEKAGFNDNPTPKEREIRKQVQYIITRLITTWQDAETAFHIVETVRRILHYQVLAALSGDDAEFMEPDDLGNERNKRNPSVKRFRNKDGEYESWIFNVEMQVFPDGSRRIEPDKRTPALMVSGYPICPFSKHTILRNKPGDETKLEPVREIYNGLLYHFPPEQKDDEPQYKRTEKDSLAI